MTDTEAKALVRSLMLIATNKALLLILTPAC